MSIPNIGNWFSPEANDDQAPEWVVGKIYYDGQEYTPEEIELFAAELVKLATSARSAASDDLMVSYKDIRESLALILGSGEKNILGALDDAVSNNLGD